MKLRLHTVSSWSAVKVIMNVPARPVLGCSYGYRKGMRLYVLC